MNCLSAVRSSISTLSTNQAGFNMALSWRNLILWMVPRSAASNVNMSSCNMITMRGLISIRSHALIIKAQVLSSYFASLEFISVSFRFRQRSFPRVSILSKYGNENIRVRSSTFDVTSDHVNTIFVNWNKYIHIQNKNDRQISNYSISLRRRAQCVTNPK